MNKIKRIAGLMFTAALLTTMFCFSVFAADNYNSDKYITDRSLPRTASELNFACSGGSDWTGSSPVSPPAVLGDKLVAFSGKKIFLVDQSTGKKVREGDMEAASQFSCIPPACAEAEGRTIVIAPLSNGTIQAFDSETLEPVWTAKNERGGKAMSHLKVSKDRVYTGFWNGETSDADFVCIDINTGKELWHYTHKGGFYWTEAEVVGNSLIVGTDDGQRTDGGTSKLLFFDISEDGCSENSSTLAVPYCSFDLEGDQRSGIVYSREEGRVYLTTKSGWLYSVAVDETTGKPDENSLKKCRAGSETTNSPVVYKGRVYVAAMEVSGSSIGKIQVLDATDLTEICKVRLKYCPKASMIMTTAYEDKTGYLYFYTTYNSKPGGILGIRIKADDTTGESAGVFNVYNASGYEEYCVSPVTCDEAGNLYYKNDSGRIFSLAADTTDISHIPASLSRTSATWTGSEIRPTVSIEGLTEGDDYTIKYKNNRNAGAASAVVSGSGEYSSSQVIDFSILPPKITGAKVYSNGFTMQKVKWNKSPAAGTAFRVKCQQNGKTVKTVYTSGTQASFSKLRKGTLYKYTVTPYALADDKKLYGPSSSCSAYTRPEGTKITGLTAGTKRITVKWSKKPASGYIVYMSANSRFGKGTVKKTIKTTSTTKYTFRNLKKGRKYYFKIKTYKGTTANCSDWSKVKTIKSK